MPFPQQVVKHYAPVRACARCTTWSLPGRISSVTWRPAVGSPSITMIFFVAIQSWMDDSTHHVARSVRAGTQQPTPKENILQVELLEQTCLHEIVPVGSAHSLASV